MVRFWLGVRMRLILAALLLLPQVPPKSWFFAAPPPAGGPTVNEDFTSCSNMTSIQNSITCSSGTAGGGTNFAKNKAYSATTLSTANHYAEIDGDWNGDFTKIATPIIRCNGNGTSSTGYYISVNNSGANINITLYKFSGSTDTYVDETTINSQNLSSGTRYKMRFFVNSSNQFSFWIDVDDDGTYQADEKKDAFTTDSTYTTGTYVGLFVYRDDSDSRADWLQGDDE